MFTHWMLKSRNNTGITEQTSISIQQHHKMHIKFNKRASETVSTEMWQFELSWREDLLQDFCLEGITFSYSRCT